MIGRTEKVRPFDLIRWAREQARTHALTPREAHVLLLLATYANDEATAWPSIKTLALDCGLKPTKDGRNSSVSAAVARLEELRLVWTKQAGHGHSARRELLFDPVAWRQQPSGQAEGCTDQPSGTQEGYAQPSEPLNGSSLPESRTQPSGYQDPKYQRGAKTTSTTNSKGQRKPSGYAEGFPSGVQEGNNNGNNNVREEIEASLATSRVLAFADGLRRLNENAVQMCPAITEEKAA